MRARKLACLTVGLSLATTDRARPRTIPGEPDAMEKNASLKKISFLFIKQTLTTIATIMRYLVIMATLDVSLALQL